MSYLKGVAEDCVRFYDVEARVEINLVPFSKLTFCPRIGETVVLPGEGGAGQGMYEVVSVYHSFAEDSSGGTPAPAKAIMVRIDVKRKPSADGQNKSHLSQP